MVNNLASSCENCTRLLRLITLNNLINNRRVLTKYVCTKDNFLADSLSRFQYKHFWNLAPATMNKYPSVISPLVWPAIQLWDNH